MLLRALRTSSLEALFLAAGGEVALTPPLSLTESGSSILLAALVLSAIFSWCSVLAAFVPAFLPFVTSMLRLLYYSWRALALGASG